MIRLNYEIDELDLSVRVYNVLARAGIKTIYQLEGFDDEGLKGIYGLSGKGISEIKEKLSEYRRKETAEERHNRSEYMKGYLDAVADTCNIIKNIYVDERGMYDTGWNDALDRVKEKINLLNVGG